jgi:hypothetical protein
MKINIPVCYINDPLVFTNERESLISYVKENGGKSFKIISMHGSLAILEISSSPWGIIEIYESASKLEVLKKLINYCK